MINIEKIVLDDESALYNIGKGMSYWTLTTLALVCYDSCGYYLSG